MRGRKPQANAIRRGGAQPGAIPVVAAPIEHGVTKPDEVIANPDLDAIWDTVVGSGAAYRQQDEPLLTQLVYWLDVARTCRAAMTAPDGRTLMTVVGVGPKGPDGRHRDFRPNPYLAQMEKATNMVLRLSDQLGCTPLARARIGVTEAATQSMQVDIAARIRALMDEREGGR